jgi:hypothetical protein
MDHEADETGQDPKLTKLNRLEAALARGEPWSRDEREWLIAGLREALARLAEDAAFIPVDPSRIG